MVWSDQECLGEGEKQIGPGRRAPTTSEKKGEKDRAEKTSRSRKRD